MAIITYESGPCGGNGGDQQQDNPSVASIPADAVITGFTPYSDSSYVQQIALIYNSASQGSGKVTFGSTNGTALPTVTLQAGESITSIQGTFGGTVQTMQIVTNDNQYGPFGSSAGNRNFRLDIPGGCRLTGVFGFTGSKIDSIGILFMGPSGI